MMIRSMSVLAVLLLSGCATVQLPGTEGKQPWEVVKLSGHSGLDPLMHGFGSGVCAIDGQRLNVNGRGCPTDITFLPGTHTVAIVATDTGAAGEEVDVTQDFKPGEVYEVGIYLKADSDKPNPDLKLDHTVPPPANP